MVPGKSEWKFRYLIFQIISVTDGWAMSCELTHRWLSLDLNDDKSTLVQVMVWCRLATSHCLNKCWPRPLSPYCVTRPQWVKNIWQNSKWNAWWKSCSICLTWLSVHSFVSSLVETYIVIATVTIAIIIAIFYNIVHMLHQYSVNNSNVSYNVYEIHANMITKVCCYVILSIRPTRGSHFSPDRDFLREIWWTVSLKNTVYFSDPMLSKLNQFN